MHAGITHDSTAFKNTSLHTFPICNNLPRWDLYFSMTLMGVRGHWWHRLVVEIFILIKKPLTFIIGLAGWWLKKLSVCLLIHLKFYGFLYSIGCFLYVIGYQSVRWLLSSQHSFSDLAFKIRRTGALIQLHVMMHIMSNECQLFTSKMLYILRNRSVGAVLETGNDLLYVIIFVIV